jgi:hypothetical protein
MNSGISGLSGLSGIFGPGGSGGGGGKKLLTAMLRGTGAGMSMSYYTFLLNLTGYPLLTPLVPLDAPSLLPWSDKFTPPGSGSPLANTPTVVASTTNANSGDLLHLSGLFSADTIFQVYGQTTLINGTISPLTANGSTSGNITGYPHNNVAEAIIPTTHLPNSFYYVYPINSFGTGNPIAVNRAESWWTYPTPGALNYYNSFKAVAPPLPPPIPVIAGESTRLMGANMAYSFSQSQTFITFPGSLGLTLTWTTWKGMNYAPGQRVFIWDLQNVRQSMVGTVSLYNSITGVLSVTITSVTPASGPYATSSLWNINGDCMVYLQCNEVSGLGFPITPTSVSNYHTDITLPGGMLAVGYSNTNFTPQVGSGFTFTTCTNSFIGSTANTFSIGQVLTFLGYTANHIYANTTPPTLFHGTVTGITGTSVTVTTSNVVGTTAFSKWILCPQFQLFVHNGHGGAVHGWSQKPVTIYNISPAYDYSDNIKNISSYSDATHTALPAVTSNSTVTITNSGLVSFKTQAGGGFASGMTIWAVANTPQIGTITAVSTDNPMKITSASHGLQTGNTVVIQGVVGAVKANGPWSVTVLDANTFTVPFNGAIVAGNGSNANYAYVSGGIWLSVPYMSGLFSSYTDNGDGTWQLAFTSSSSGGGGNWSSWDLCTDSLAPLNSFIGYIGGLNGPNGTGVFQAGTYYYSAKPSQLRGGYGASMWLKGAGQNLTFQKPLPTFNNVQFIDGYYSRISDMTIDTSLPNQTPMINTAATGGEAVNLTISQTNVNPSFDYSSKFTSWKGCKVYNGGPNVIIAEGQLYDNCDFYLGDNSEACTGSQICTTTMVYQCTGQNGTGQVALNNSGGRGRLSLSFQAGMYYAYAFGNQTIALAPTAPPVSGVPWDPNAGEQILWCDGGAGVQQAISTASGTNVNTLSVSGTQHHTTGYLQGTQAIVTKGTGIGQTAIVLSESWPSITLDSTWPIIGTDSVINFCKSASNVAIHGNIQSGSGFEYCANSGMSWYGGGFNMHYDGNSVANMPYGTTITTTGAQGALANFCSSPVYYCSIKNNFISQCMYAHRINDNGPAPGVGTANNYYLTSSTSNTYSAGTIGLTLSFTVATGGFFTANEPITVYRTSDNTKWVAGYVQSYNSGTGALVVFVQSVSGSGSFSDWLCFITGNQSPSNITFNNPGSVGASFTWNLQPGSQAFSVGDKIAAYAATALTTTFTSAAVVYATVTNYTIGANYNTVTATVNSLTGSGTGVAWLIYGGNTEAFTIWGVNYRNNVVTGITPTGTSVTANSYGTGNKSFKTQSGLKFNVNQIITGNPAWSTSNVLDVHNPYYALDQSNVGSYLYGAWSSYTDNGDGTWQFVVNATSFSGSSPSSNWVLKQSSAMVRFDGGSSAVVPKMTCIDGVSFEAGYWGTTGALPVATNITSAFTESSYWTGLYVALLPATGAGPVYTVWGGTYNGDNSPGNLFRQPTNNFSPILINVTHSSGFSG